MTMDEQDVFNDITERYPHAGSVIVSSLVSKQFGCQYSINISPDFVVVGKTWEQAMEFVAMEEARRAA
jgi:hypothetical protein